MTMAGMKRREPEPSLFERFCEWLENLLRRKP